MRRLVKDLAVIALGSNAILRKNDKRYVEEIWRNIYRAAEPIVDLFIRGNKIIVTHGNGLGLVIYLSGSSAREIGFHL